jgi:hypothetical protein
MYQLKFNQDTPLTIGALVFSVSTARTQQISNQVTEQKYLFRFFGFLCAVVCISRILICLNKNTSLALHFP